MGGREWVFCNFACVLRILSYFIKDCTKGRKLIISSKSISTTLKKIIRLIMRLKNNIGLLVFPNATYKWSQKWPICCYLSLLSRLRISKTIFSVHTSVHFINIAPKISIWPPKSKKMAVKKLNKGRNNRWNLIGPQSISIPTFPNVGNQMITSILNFDKCILKEIYCKHRNFIHCLNTGTGICCIFF